MTDPGRRRRKAQARLSELLLAAMAQAQGWLMQIVRKRQRTHQFSIEHPADVFPILGQRTKNSCISAFPGLYKNRITHHPCKTFFSLSIRINLSTKSPLVCSPI